MPMAGLDRVYGSIELTLLSNLTKTETNMIHRSRHSPSLGAAALSASLMLAVIPAFAADFPAEGGDATFGAANSGEGAEAEA